MIPGKEQAILSKIILIGRIGTPPQTSVRKGKLMCAFKLGAKNEGAAETDWYDISLWGKWATSGHKLLGKGDLIYLEGLQQIHRYKDEEGNEGIDLRVMAVSYKLLVKKKQNLES